MNGKRLINLKESHALLDELRKKYYFRRKTEFINIDESLNRELAEDLVSQGISPPHNLASYDGYALQAEDSQSYPLKIVYKIYAGEKSNNIPMLRKGEAMAIATGAFLPKGSNAVLRLEDAEIKGNLLFGVAIKKGTKVVKAGSNYKKGDMILTKGHRIRPQEVGLLNDLNIDKVKVFKKPIVAIFSTGNEICNGINRDINAPMIMAFLKEWGCKVNYLGAVPDDLEKIKKVLLKTTKYDATITSGGVSVGEKDYTLKAMNELGNMILYKVKTRPGKPIAIGIINDRPVFGLPGKPTGAFTAIELNLKRYFLGNIFKPTLKAKIGETIKLNVKDTDTMDMANIVFVHCKNGTAYPVGFPKSHMRLINPGELYNVSTIASSIRATIADGYTIVKNDLNKGNVVEVTLF
jgi:molybdenum cofactor synthesis domain-containing protein